MKKFCSTIVFASLLLFIIGAGVSAEEEIDFLLFAPDSIDRFANEEQETIHLDNLAKYLLGRNLLPGQISVRGYAAMAHNDIDPMYLSTGRAIFVINELQRRGVPAELFSEPVGHGEVDLWGANITEEDRSPNRRVRIFIDGEMLTIAALTVTPEESAASFPWWLLLLPLAAVVLFILYSKTKSARLMPVATIATITSGESYVYLEERIRRRAYELYLDRNGENGDADDDWYRAVPEVCFSSKAQGYDVYTEDGCWWAYKDSNEYTSQNL